MPKAPFIIQQLKFEKLEKFRKKFNGNLPKSNIIENIKYNTKHDNFINRPTIYG